MKFTKYIATACTAAVIGITAVAAFGQGDKIKGDKVKNKDFCHNWNWSSDDKVNISDLRETTLSSTGSVTVDAGRNGGVSVIGSDRSDVLLRSCVQTWGTTEEAAKAAAANVKINTSGTIRAESSDEKGWSVSFQLLVPRATNVELTAHNGGITIANVDGRAQFETTNGGVHLKNVSGNVTGHTTNGGLHVALDGTTWRGTGLNVTTTNGGVHLVIPATYSARIESGTVNGGFHSNIPALNVTTENVSGGDYWTKHRPKRIDTVLNTGGPTIRLMTTNGGVQISTPE